MATHYPLKKLHRSFEKWCGERISEFPGPDRNKEYYSPVRTESPKSTRFWVRFYRKAGYDICVFGDFKGDLKPLEKKVNIGFQNLYTSENNPDPIAYKNERKKFASEWAIIKRMPKRHNDYTSAYVKTEYKPYNHQNTLYLPYINPLKPNCPLQAVEIIDAKGQKFFATNSEVVSSFHIVKMPVSRASIMYISEGLNSALACLLGAPRGSGVVCTGGLNNLEQVILFFKSKGYPIALAIEEKGKDKYMELKEKHDCMIVGDPAFEDIDDFYKKTNITLLKKNLVQFKEKNFIALGIDKKNDVVCYIQSLDNVKTYPAKDRDLLYCDVHNAQTTPDKEVTKKFYFKVRFQCRIVGGIQPLNRVKFGIFPDKKEKNFYYWDMQNLYLIKEGDEKSTITKIPPLSAISSDFLLCKENAKKRPDLTKLTPLSPCELNDLLKTLFMFKFKPIEYRLLVGWIIQSFLCGGLPYRAPIWITAPTGHGKSHISKRFLMALFPEKDRKTGRNSTPKYFTRHYSGKAMPLHRDEYEPNKRHAQNTMEEMEYIRASATERFPSRGISFGLGDETISFEYCLSVLFTSIKTPRELSNADYARILFFYMGYKHHPEYEQKMREFEKRITPTLQYRFLLTCLQQLHNIRKAYFNACGKKNIRLITNHKKSSVFMLASCYNALRCFNDKIPLNEAVEHIKAIDEKENESRILKTILSLSLKKQHYSFGESYMLIECLNDKELNKEMKKKGIYRKGSYLYIDAKRGLLFVQRLFGERGEIVETINLKKELANDGKYYIDSIEGKLRFDWLAVKEDYFGKEV